MTALVLLAVLAAEAKGDANAAAQAAVEMQNRMRVAQEEAVKACAPLETQPLPLEQEKKLGTQHAESLRKKHGATVTGPVADYVQKIGAAVAKGAQRQELTWTFEVLQNPEPKTGHVPGGGVLVTTGMLAALKNEAQLASVLAHEIAHLDLDLPTRLSKANSSACRTKRSMQAVPKSDLPKEAQGVDDSMAMMMDSMAFLLPLEFGPTVEDEHGADGAALSLMVRAGYSVAEQRKVLETVAWGSLFASKLPEGRAAKLPVPKVKPGKAPPFPKKLKWPAP